MKAEPNRDYCLYERKSFTSEPSDSLVFPFECSTIGGNRNFLFVLWLRRFNGFTVPIRINQARHITSNWKKFDFHDGKWNEPQIRLMTLTEFVYMSGNPSRQNRIFSNKFQWNSLDLSITRKKCVTFQFAVQCDAGCVWQTVDSPLCCYNVGGDE